MGTLQIGIWVLHISNTRCWGLSAGDVGSGWEERRCVTCTDLEHDSEWPIIQLYGRIWCYKEERFVTKPLPDSCFLLWWLPYLKGLKRESTRLHMRTHEQEERILWVLSLIRVAISQLKSGGRPLDYRKKLWETFHYQSGFLLRSAKNLFRGTY